MITSWVLSLEKYRSNRSMIFSISLPAMLWPSFPQLLSLEVTSELVWFVNRDPSQWFLIIPIGSMVYTANKVIICYLPPFTRTWKMNWKDFLCNPNTSFFSWRFFFKLWITVKMPLVMGCWRKPISRGYLLEPISPFKGLLKGRNHGKVFLVVVFCQTNHHLVDFFSAGSKWPAMFVSYFYATKTWPAKFNNKIRLYLKSWLASRERIHIPPEEKENHRIKSPGWYRSQEGILYSPILRNSSGARP